MEHINTLAKGAGIAFIGVFLSKLLSYFYRLIAARIGAEPYGLINIALGLVSLIVLFPILGLDSGMERYVAYFKGKKDDKKIYEILTSSLTLAFGLSFVFCILLFLFSDKIAVYFFHNAKLGLVLKIFSMAIPFYTLERICLAALRAIKKNQYEVYSKALFQNISKIILTIVLVYLLGWGLFGLSLSFLIGIVGMGLLAFYYLYKQILITLKNYKLILVDKEVLQYSSNLMFYSLFYLILFWTDTLMIGYFLGASQAGIYNVALPTASLLVLFPVALRSLFLPTITTLYAKNEKEKIKQTYSSLTRWIFLINLPILLLFILFSKKILHVLFGAEYVVGFSCLIVLSLGYFLFSFLDISSSLLSMLKKSKLILFNSMGVAILNIILNSILIPKYGITGAAVATSISLIILGLLASLEGWIYTRLQPIRKYYLRLIIILGVTLLIMWGLSRIIGVTTFMDLVFLSFYFVGLYVALILLTKSLREEDVKLVKESLLKLKNYF